MKIKPSWTQYNKTNSPIGKTYRAVMSKREGKKMLLSLHGYKGSAVIYALEYYCNIYNIIIFKGEHEKGTSNIIFGTFQNERSTVPTCLQHKHC